MMVLSEFSFDNLFDKKVGKILKNIFYTVILNKFSKILRKNETKKISKFSD
jgi:hypothetical protein